MFNTLLGNIPLLGRLFSPEAGGGVFAGTYRVQGPLADPQVTVNPLAALTPGFLRGLFGLGQPAERGRRRRAEVSLAGAGRRLPAWPPYCISVCWLSDRIAWFRWWC
ncbi:hypothetical protein ACFQU2_30460 [Siccirubricoccus deserti]